MSNDVKQVWAGIGALILIGAIALPLVDESVHGTVSGEGAVLFITAFCLVFFAPIFLTGGSNDAKQEVVAPPKVVQPKSVKKLTAREQYLQQVDRYNREVREDRNGRIIAVSLITVSVVFLVVSALTVLV